jgi:hypothetical protein
MGNFVESVGRAIVLPAVREGGGRALKASLELRDRNCINSIADNRTAIVNVQVFSSFEISNALFRPPHSISTLRQKKHGRFSDRMCAVRRQNPVPPRFILLFLLPDARRTNENQC